MPDLDPPVPPGLRLRPAEDLHVRQAGTVLVGGSPLRLLRLSPAGARRVAAWWQGEPVGEALAERRLARRLLDAGLAHPQASVTAGEREPPWASSGAHPSAAQGQPQQPPSAERPDGGGRAPSPPLTVIIPSYRNAAGLERCLAALGGRWPVIVVDDGSPNRSEMAAVARRWGARYLLQDANRGPAAARNRGLAAADTELVVLLDSDCLASPQFPHALLHHMRDPALAVVAPRVMGGQRPGRLAAYERVRSPLDMGEACRPVAPAGSVRYLPSVALLARRSALLDVAGPAGPFDERLRTGEDVDLSWRLYRRGWRARLDPTVTVTHDSHPRAPAWYRRRVAYNLCTAALSRRHPGSLPVVVISAPAAVAWAATLAGHPVALALLATARTFRLRGRLAAAGPDAWPWALRRAGAELGREAGELTRAALGPWAPFALLALAAGRRTRLARRLALLVGGALARDWYSVRSEIGPLSYAAIRVADETARGFGVWLGALRERHFLPLLPADPAAPSFPPRPGLGTRAPASRAPAPASRAPAPASRAPGPPARAELASSEPTPATNTP